jgi:membrane protease YdiL (CAAX protease family)
METVKTTRKYFSKIGLMYLLGTLIITGVQYLVYYLLAYFFPAILENYTAYFLILMLTMYIVSMPLMALLIRTIPAEAPAEKKKMTVKQWLIAAIIAFSGMYISNIIGNILTTIIGFLKGSSVSNDLLTIATSNSTWANFLIMVLCAPVAEEFLFRKLLIDRTAKYGEGISVLFSALIFGLFHGNLNQFAYAFVLGAVFGFIYVKTRDIKYTIFLHMLINFMGSIVSLALLNYSGLTELLSVSDDLSAEELISFTSGHIAGILLYLLYALFLLAIVIAGIVLFFVNLNKIHLHTTEYSVPAGKRFVIYFVNVGVILFCIYWIVQIIIQLFS